MLYQRTIGKKISVTGIGVHTGKKISLTLHPASSDHGLKFRRVDLKNSEVIEARFDTVGATELNTTIGSGENVVHTIEHLVAVLYGFGINNIYCEIDGPEVPVMDGSGASFAFLVKEAGIMTLDKLKKFIVVTDTVRIESGDKWAEISPSSNLVIDSTIDFNHPIIKKQVRNFEFTCENFIDEISRARTFGFLRDVDYLKKRGLAKGGSLDNCIVLDDYKVMNPDGIRFPDEFVRHKILDTIGDVALLGYDIAGKITTYKSGHNLHNLLCKKLIQTKSAYKIVTSDELSEEAVSAFDIPNTVSPIFQPV